MDLSKKVLIFVIYSHKDARYLDALLDALAALKRSGRVEIWHDKLMDAGRDWDRTITEKLSQADLVLPIVSAHFFGSVYCIERELQYAQDREGEGLCDIVPVLAEPCDHEAHWISKLEFLPSKKKAVSAYTPRSLGWTEVAKGVRAKVGTFPKQHAVRQTLDQRSEIMHSGQIHRDENTARSGSIEFQNISQFWRAQSQLETAAFATVKGTLSRFSPFTMGPPRAKGRLHKEFRRALEIDREFGQKKRITIDACMSLSAGQMVVRETLGEGEKIPLGLYGSIVRNSIPIFVRRRYFDQVVSPLLEHSKDMESFEATVTGRLFRLDNKFNRRFLVRQELTQVLQKSSIDDLCENGFALEVGDEKTAISATGLAHYVDGDIWLAVRGPDGSERFMTSFLDLTNGEERTEEIRNLRELAAIAGLEVFAACDNVPSLEDLTPDEPLP